MSSAATITAVEELSESQRAALVNLLADEDPAVYQTVRQKILSFGPPATKWLRPHTLSSDPALRRRVQQIVLHLERQTADSQFLSFCLKHGEDFDLEQGVWLLARTQYPEINVEAYQALLDSFADSLRERLQPGQSAKLLLATFNQFLFSELGFSGNEENYYDPDNNYLNRVVDRRTGNPINLCLVFLLLARRLRLPVTGIGLPGHFVCRYQSTSDEVYIDVFNRGKFLTKADCIQHLVRGNFGLREEFLTPLTPRKILLRCCSNLHQVFQQLEAVDDTARMQRYLVALAR
jgi:regulator of sirC expression with transglutaminase-like and TPR domain